MNSFPRNRGRFALLTVLLLLLTGCDRCGRNLPPPPQRVVLFVIDTLRADHVGAYGYQRNTTPSLDRIARDGVRFENAVATCSWTQPSMASLFTSTYPTVHHVIKAPGDEIEMSVLPPDLVTIAEMLKDRGMVTQAINSQPWISEISGFNQGFDDFEVVSDLMDPHESQKVVDRALQWMAQQKDDEPFFLYLHVMGPHWPYNPPEEFQGKFTTAKLAELQALFKDQPYQDQLKILTDQKARFEADPDLLAELVALYDEDTALADQQVGRLYDEIVKRGWRDSTMLIVVADHGEEFLDHGGFLHGFTLYHELLHVPLIIHYPPLGAGRTVNSLVSLVDVLPTIAELVRVDPPAAAQGISLLPVMAGKAGRQTALSELLVKRVGRIKITTPDHSLFYQPKYEDQPEESWLYDLKQDPRETHDLAREQPGLTQQLTDQLLTLEYENSLVKIEPARARPISPDLLNRLQALGYFQGH